MEDEIRKMLRTYRTSLAADRQRLLDGFRYEHMARKVVGVGSVGTRAWIVLLLGRDDQDPLFLQVKEAQRSVLEPFAGAAREKNQGQRVVEGQRLMQASSDILLGWLRVEGVDGAQRDFYVRQLWDWKLSADLESMRPSVAARARASLRLDARPGARALRRPDRDRVVPRIRRRVRPRSRRVRGSVRGPERARLPRADRRGRVGRHQRASGRLTSSATRLEGDLPDDARPTSRR